MSAVTNHSGQTNVYTRRRQTPAKPSTGTLPALNTLLDMHDTQPRQASYLRRAAADGSDLVAERRHRHQQFVVLVEDTAAGGLVQTQQAFTAQHVQRET